MVKVSNDIIKGTAGAPILIDTRIEAVFKQGAIPGSKNIPFTSVLNGDKTYKSPEELRKVFSAAGIENPDSANLITTCQRGITACQFDIALRLLGKDNTPTYDGSYEEYSRRWLEENKAKLNVAIEGEGEGQQCPPGSRVLVHYTGKLTDGTVFDSSHERGKPLDFVVGVG